MICSLWADDSLGSQIKTLANLRLSYSLQAARVRDDGDGRNRIYGWAQHSIHQD